MCSRTSRLCQSSSRPLAVIALPMTLRDRCILRHVPDLLFQYSVFVVSLAGYDTCLVEDETAVSRFATTSLSCSFVR